MSTPQQSARGSAPPPVRAGGVGRLSLALGLCVLAGCGSTGVITSLDDLTAHVDQEGVLSLKQQRALSLSGLMPSGPTGSLYRFDGERSPFTSVGLSAITSFDAPEDDDGDDTEASDKTLSYVHQRWIPNTTCMSELVEIRDKLIDVRLAAAKLIRKRVERLAKAPDDRAGADSAVTSAQSTFDTELRTAHRMLDKPGLMVVRVESASEGNWTTRLGEILGLSSERRNDRAGFALLAGLRTSFLFAGNDLVEHFDVLTHDWSLIGRRIPFVIGLFWWGPVPIPYPGQLSYADTFLVTSQLEAQHVLYAQDSVTERKIEAEFEATLDELENLGALAAAEKLEIETVLSSVESLGSMGVVGNVQQRIVPFDMSAAIRELIPDDPRAPLPAPAPGPCGTSHDDAWLTIYAVLSEADDLDTLVSGNLRPHFSSIF